MLKQVSYMDFQNGKNYAKKINKNFQNWKNFPPIRRDMRTLC